MSPMMRLLLYLYFALILVILANCSPTEVINEMISNSADRHLPLSHFPHASHQRDTAGRKYSEVKTNSNSHALLAKKNDEKVDEYENGVPENSNSFATIIPFPTPEPFRIEFDAFESGATKEYYQSSTVTDAAEQQRRTMKSKKDKGEDQSSDAADEKSEENDEWLPDEVGEGPTGHPLTDESSQFSDHPSHEQYIDDYEREVSDTILEPTQNDPANLAQSLAETLLQEIFAQNMNILQVTITKERVERNGSVTVINQEENIYYLESVLTLITDGETPTSRVFFSQSHVGQTNITKKNATRCEYSNRGAFYYDPMHLLQYPVHVHTSNESKFENFGQYRKLNALYFNCPLFEKCCELDCCSLTDKEIIAKMFRLSADFDEKTSKYIVPDHAMVKYKGAKFKLLPSVEYSIVSYKILDASTIRTQCEHKLSDLDGGLFNSVMVDNGDVIDSLFEIFAAQVSCTINGTCCGILCCKTFPPFIQFKPTTEAQPTVTVKEATKSVWLAAASLFGLMGGILGVSAVAIACILVSKKLVKSARSHGKHKSDSWSSYTM